MRVARKYYELHQGQLEISRDEGVSKSTISRMLQKAVDLGYVKIKVEYPLESVNEIAEQMKELFQLKDVFITPNVIDDESITLKDTCRAFADRLDRYIHDDCIVGVSWGKTLNCLSEYINKIQAKNIQVVQLIGGVSKHTIPTGAGRIVDAVTKAGKGTGYMFPVPALVDSREIFDALKKDSTINSVLNMAKAAEVTIFSIGAVEKTSILYEVGYLDDDDFEQLKKADAAGDIALRFFDVQGNIANESLNERVVGLALEDFKDKKYNIAIAVGERKTVGILGALRGGYVNVLYTDEKTARKVLAMVRENQC